MLMCNYARDLETTCVFYEKRIAELQGEIAYYAGGNSSTVSHVREDWNDVLDSFVQVQRPRFIVDALAEAARASSVPVNAAGSTSEVIFVA